MSDEPDLRVEVLRSLRQVLDQVVGHQRSRWDWACGVLGVALLTVPVAFLIWR